VDSDVLWRIFLITFAYGAFRVTLDGYLSWRRRRASIPPSARNSGLLTDGRLKAFEIISISAAALFVIFIYGSTVYIVGMTRGWFPIP